MGKYGYYRRFDGYKKELGDLRKLDGEQRIIIAFIFKRSGKTKLKDSEVYLPLSIELGWFSTKDAQEFIEFAIKEKLLVKEDEMLSPTFDIEEINIPIGFFPTKSKYKKNDEESSETLIENIIVRIIEKTNLSKEEILKSMTDIQKEKKIIPEVAVLMFAKTYGINLDDFLDQVEEIIFKENE